MFRKIFIIPFFFFVLSCFLISVPIAVYATENLNQDIISTQINNSMIKTVNPYIYKNSDNTFSFDKELMISDGVVFGELDMFLIENSIKHSNRQIRLGRDEKSSNGNSIVHKWWGTEYYLNHDTVDGVLSALDWGSGLSGVASVATAAFPGTQVASLPLGILGMVLWLQGKVIGYYDNGDGVIVNVPYSTYLLYGGMIYWFESA